tara:strand:- start:586 stop:1653 length:1068 start_codon:yes stop_codon:yes gene_type:complete
MKALPLQFKFRWLDEQGNVTGFFTSKRGSFDGQELVLDDVTLPAANIMSLEVFQDRIAVAFVAAGMADSAAFKIFKCPATDLKRAVDVSRSAAWAEMTREKMVEEGRGGSFRTTTCPQCTATLDVSDMPETPQIYCHYCDTLTTPASGGLPNEQDFGLCEECGMFSKPRKFTIFYFYFLVAVWGYRTQVTHRCPACMRKEAWKMLLGNLPFLLGVPVAITQLIRCYGGKITGSVVADLDGANIRARKGDMLGALQGYQKVLDQVPFAAGVKYNLSLALLQQQETERAAGSLELAFKDCANYAPAYPLLSACYEEIGEEAKLKELRRIWGDDDVPTLDDEPHDEPSNSLDDDDVWA